MLQYEENYYSRLCDSYEDHEYYVYIYIHIIQLKIVKNMEWAIYNSLTLAKE